MVDLLRRLEVGPEDARASVIWLHGLGASGHDFADVPSLLGLPDVRFVFPHAPDRPVTINMGLIMPAWFDVRRLAGDAFDAPAPDGTDDDAIDARGVRQSVEQVRALIEHERGRGVPPERIVLGGFSQGGSIALFAGVRHPERLAGIMVLSAWELLAHTREREQAEANRLTPLLVCHGRYDPVVPLVGGQRAYETYAQGGRPARFHAFPMEHAVCMEEIQVIREWLHSCLAPPAPPAGSSSG
jgi:phospholipase/carboxylesterase